MPHSLPEEENLDFLSASIPAINNMGPGKWLKIWSEEENLDFLSASIPAINNMGPGKWLKIWYVRKR